MNNNSNDNNGKDIAARKVEVESQAERLVQTFGSPHSIQFYYKVCWRISPHRINQLVEQAVKGREPGRLFNYPARLEPSMQEDRRDSDDLNLDEVPF